MTKQHAIYGLYLPDHPDVILYVGSWRVATLDERLRQHRDGECKTTAKMAGRNNIKIGDLHMKVLAYWMPGINRNPEGEVILDLQTRASCPWNHPYAFTTEDCRKAGRIGGRKVSETWGKTPEAHEARSHGGRNSMRKMNATWGKTPEAHEARVRAGHIGGPVGGRIGGRSLAKTGWHQTPEGQLAHSRGGLMTGPTNIRKLNETWGKTLEAYKHRVHIGHIGNREGKARGGRMGWRKMNATWGKTPEAREAKVRGGRNGSHEDKMRAGRLGNCSQHHSDRPKIDRLCAECAAKVSQE